MKKKGVLVLLFAIFIAGGVFAQDKATKPHKHEAFDMLLGIGMGLDLGFKLEEGNNSLQFDFNAGVNYDFYVFPWLSASTGLMFGPSISASIGDSDVGVNGGIYMTLPLSVHFNIPYVEWLYLGVGAGFNIPIATLGDTFGIPAKYYTSLPIDFGFDFAKTEKRAGGRFIFKIIPNFQTLPGTDYSGNTTTVHKTIMTYGFVWQFYNWKIFSKK
ncbi:hypothetical protein AGMMS49587_10470 [Spirochaetia bacterium]|nr:hypothetical protein AGMMS49587_10470 [Spirochaetia bacterium]